MKHLTQRQKFSALLGAGLLMAAASGSAFASHTSEAGDLPRHEVRQQRTPATQTPTVHTSPLPARGGQSNNEVEFQDTVKSTKDHHQDSGHANDNNGDHKNGNVNDNSSNDHDNVNTHEGQDHNNQDKSSDDHSGTGDHNAKDKSNVNSNDDHGNQSHGHDH